jgi:YebC/PmpR family DNA-binding regulatory protein
MDVILSARCRHQRLLGCGLPKQSINIVALIVEALTDNRNRTATNVRTAFAKNGGNLGASGAVSHGFERLGLIEYSAAAGDEDKVLEAAIEAGADDVNTNDDGSIEVITAPTEFIAVKDALEAAGFKPEFAEVTMKPEGENVFAGDDGLKMQKLLDALESLDDVQEIYTTAVIED